jgi:hypothetical protein
MHVAARGRSKENRLVIVLSFSVVLGMAVALGVYYAWTSGVIAPGLEHPLTVAALVFCPPFILSLAVAPKPDSALAFVLVVGTIIFANAFLYAGVAAGAYFVVSIFVGRKRNAT